MNINALIRSSSDPAKVSMFVKSLVAFGVLFGLDSTVLNAAGGDLVNFIVGWGMVASAGTGLWGIGRKIANGRWS